MLHITITKDNKEILLDTDTKGIIGVYDKDEENSAAIRYLNDISGKDTFCLYKMLDEVKKAMEKDHPELRLLDMVMNALHDEDENEEES